MTHLLQPMDLVSKRVYIKRASPHFWYLWAILGAMRQCASARFSESAEELCPVRDKLTWWTMLLAPADDEEAAGSGVGDAEAVSD